MVKMTIMPDRRASGRRGRRCPRQIGHEEQCRHGRQVDPQFPGLKRICSLGRQPARRHPRLGTSARSGPCAGDEAAPELARGVVMIFSRNGKDRRRFRLGLDTGAPYPDFRTVRRHLSHWQSKWVRAALRAWPPPLILSGSVSGRRKVSISLLVADCVTQPEIS
jgi:hypothetical protein